MPNYGVEPIWPTVAQARRWLVLSLILSQGVFTPSAKRLSRKPLARSLRYRRKLASAGVIYNSSKSMSHRGEVLVAIINDLLDFTIAHDKHWYRLPIDSQQKWLKER